MVDLPPPADDNLPSSPWGRAIRNKSIRFVFFLFTLICALSFIYFRYFSYSPANAIDIQEEYTKAVTQLGLKPIYPPREDVRVGDVFFIAHDSENNIIARLWFGRINEVSETAKDYLKTFDFPLSGADKNGFDNLPIISFPKFSGAVSGAGFLGSKLWEGSGQIGTGKHQNFTIEFSDVRTDGVPFGAVGIDKKVYLKELSELACTRGPILHATLSGLIGSEHSCGLNPRDGQKILTCRFEIITKVFLTKSITFNFDSAEQTSAAISTSNVAPPIINLTIESKADGEKINHAISELANDLTNSYLAAAGAMKSTANYTKTFERPVTIAYEAKWPLEKDFRICQ